MEVLVLLKACGRPLTITFQQQAEGVSSGQRSTKGAEVAAEEDADEAEEEEDSLGLSKKEQRKKEKKDAKVDAKQVIHWARCGPTWSPPPPLQDRSQRSGYPQPSKKFSEKFLAEMKATKGVVTLASGLQYKVLRAGTGNRHPLSTSPCDCHYEGRCAKDYPAGKKFDSSYDRGSPTTFAPNQVIRGWTEAMQLMVEGDKWEMYIPSNLAYGDTGRVPGCLVFTMEILKIKGGSKPKA
jgi:FKBP-type peptidyl-prolyl cis-trans isomerase FklB